MRTIRVVKELRSEYVTVNEEYSIAFGKDSVMCKRVIPDATGFHPSTFISTSRFKRALRDGSIIFTN